MPRAVCAVWILSESGGPAPGGWLGLGAAGAHGARVRRVRAGLYLSAVSGDRRFDPITVYCTALATPTDTLVYEAQCALLSCEPEQSLSAETLFRRTVHHAQADSQHLP